MNYNAIVYTDCVRGEDYVKKFEKTFTQDLQICTHYRADKKWEEIYELLVEHDKQYSTLPQILMEKVDFFLLATIRFLILEACFELEKYKEGGRLGKLFLKKVDEKRIQEQFEIGYQNIMWQEEVTETIVHDGVVGKYISAQNIVSLSTNQLVRAQVQLEQTIEISKKLYGFDHNITIKYMKDFQKLIKKIKFEEQLKVEKLQNYQDFQQGLNQSMPQLKKIQSKNIKNDYNSPLRELTLEEQVRSRLPSEFKNIQLTQGYLELVGLTNVLATLDQKKVPEPNYSSIRIVSRPGTAFSRNKPNELVKSSLGDQLQRQLAISIHQFESLSRRDRNVQSFKILKTMNEVQYDENQDRYPEVKESEIIEVSKPKFENLMMKRPQSAVTINKKKKIIPKIVVRDEQGENIKELDTKQNDRKQSALKLKRPPIFFAKKMKVQSSPTTVDKNDKSKSSGGRPETIEKSIQVIVADLEPLESYIKKTQQSDNMSHTHHDESLQEYASYMEIPLERMQQSHIEYDRLLQLLETFQNQSKIKAIKKIQRWIRRKKKQFKHKTQSKAVLLSSTRSIQQSQSSKIFYESHKIIKIQKKSTFQADIKNVLHILDDLGVQKQRQEEEEDMIDNIKAIITLLENINNLKRYFKDITLFHEVGQLGVIKWKYIGVQAGIYQGNGTHAKQNIILTQEQQEQILLQFPQSFGDINKIFHYSSNTKNAIFTLTIFIEISSKVIQLNLNFKNFEFFALMNKDAILSCPIEILNKLLNLYFEQQKISYQYEEHSTYIMLIRHVMICCDDISEEEPIVHKTMDQIKILLSSHFLHIKTINGYKMRRITGESEIDNNKLVIESRNNYWREVRKSAGYIPYMTIHVRPKSNKKTLFKPIVMGISEIIDLKKFSHQNSLRHSILEEEVDFKQMALTLMPLQDLQALKVSSEVPEEKKQEEEKPSKEELLKRYYAKRKPFTGNYFAGKENSDINPPIFSQFNPNQYMEPINVQILRNQGKWVFSSLWFKMNEEFLYQDLSFKHVINQSKQKINVGFFTIALDSKVGQKLERKKYLCTDFLDQFNLDRSILSDLFFTKKLSFQNLKRMISSIENKIHQQLEIKQSQSQEFKLEVVPNQQGYETKQQIFFDHISVIKYLQVKGRGIIQLRIREFQDYIELMIYQLHSIQYLLIYNPDKIHKIKQLARRQNEPKNFGKINELLLYIKSHNTPIGRLPKFMENYGVEYTFNYQIKQESIEQIYLFALKGILSNTFESIKGILFSYFDTYYFTLTKKLKSKIGIVKVDSTLYKLKNQPYFILVCKILPFSARTNIYKLIINHNDLQTLKINHLNFHQQIVSLVDMISIFHCNTYNKIQIIIDEYRHLVNRIQLSELDEKVQIDIHLMYKDPQCQFFKTRNQKQFRCLQKDQKNKLTLYNNNNQS